MQTAIDVTIQIFVVSTMLVLGLQVRLGRIAHGVRNWKVMMRGSLLNLVVIPAAGLLAATSIDLRGDIRTGYLLIAFSPGAPYAVKLIAIARGEVASSIGLISRFSSPESSRSPCWRISSSTLQPGWSISSW